MAGNSIPFAHLSKFFYSIRITHTHFLGGHILWDVTKNFVSSAPIRSDVPIRLTVFSFSVLASLIANLGRFPSFFP